MTASESQRRGWVTRKGYATLALASAIFIAYGSLVPLVFRPVTFAAALHEFSDSLSSPLFIRPNSDFVANVLLTIPLAYLTLAAFMTDRRGLVRGVAAIVATLAMCFVLSVAVEFAQVFSQGRTDSLSDVVAQAIGAVFGVLVWLLVGNPVTRWLRESLQEREQPAMIQRLLLAYCVVFAITQVLPLDLTISLGQLAQKYRNGMIVLKPFSYYHVSQFDAWWDYGTDVLLNVPLGMAAVLLWTEPGTKRAPWLAIILGSAVVALVEFAQIFVNSRFADVTDVLTGGIGVVLGVWAATAYSSRARSTSREYSTKTAQIARIGVVAWVGLLAAYHWNPFDFTLTASRMAEGMHEFLAVPFSSYYEGSEFHAFTEAMRKALLALPLGVLLRLSWPAGLSRRGRRFGTVASAAFGLVVLLAIEAGQVFLPARIPDITDALIGEGGLLFGLWLTARLTALTIDQQFATSPSPQRQP